MDLLSCLLPVALLISGYATVTASPVPGNFHQFTAEARKDFFVQKIAPLLVSHSKATLTGEELFRTTLFDDFIREASTIIGIDIGCDVCKDIVKAIDDLIQTKESKDLIVDIAAEVCKVLNIDSDRVCDLGVREFKDEVIDVATLHYLSPDQICGTLFGDSCAMTYDYNSNWNVTFPDVPKPPVTPVTPPKLGSPTLRILHITDLHIDLMYQAGADAECSEPICCRSNDGPPAPGIPGAGKWGDFRSCDLPLNLMKNMLQEISQTQKFDFIYLTGDLPAHNVWNQSRSDQLGMLNLVTDLLMKYFPGVKVYPSLGNHESAPVNSFPPPFITGDQSEKWLYDALVTAWIDKPKWLPQITQKDLQNGGFYSILLYPGFRLVSLNMNAGNDMNWWLRINATDPNGQLQWLISVLQAAETAGEKVHILGHIPSGITVPVWSKNYNLIVKRYESTIRGQFFGHTHKDSFEIFYDNVINKRPISVSYIAGAVTPLGEQNPGYRIYTVDGNYANSSWAVLDHETYYVNLTEANLTNKPIWRLEYKAKEAYNMTSLQPSEWNRVVEELKKNETLFQQYYMYYHRLHDVGPCDASCRSEMICNLQTSQGNDSSYC